MVSECSSSLKSRLWVGKLDPSNPRVVGAVAVLEIDPVVGFGHTDSKLLEAGDFRPDRLDHPGVQPVSRTRYPFSS